MASAWTLEMPSAADPVRLCTPRLMITSPAVPDAVRLAEYVTRNAAHLGPWEPPRPAGYASEAYWQARLESVEAERREGRAVMMIFAHRDHPAGALVGACQFSNIARGPYLGCNLGYSVDASHQGQGLMTEGLGAAINWCFEQLGLHRVQANYIPTNHRSAALLRRLGFVTEGFARDYIFIDGAWRDHVLTSRTNPSARPEAAANPDDVG